MNIATAGPSPNPLYDDLAVDGDGDDESLQQSLLTSSMSMRSKELIYSNLYLKMGETF